MMLQRAPLSDACLIAALAALTACAPETGAVAQGPAAPAYLGIETILQDGDMVNFRVAMTGARSPADVETYGRCAAAGYARGRGFGFVRHVRTLVDRAGQTWRGDAIYLVSAALPRGTKTIDAEVTVSDCGELGIPTV